MFVFLVIIYVITMGALLDAGVSYRLVFFATGITCIIPLIISLIDQYTDWFPRKIQNRPMVESFGQCKIYNQGKVMLPDNVFFYFTKTLYFTTKK